jgi:hypothetical protein
VPELQVCFYCTTAIDEKETWVVLDKSYPKETWRYAHRDCHDGKVRVEEVAKAAKLAVIGCPRCGQPFHPDVIDDHVVECTR